MVKTHRCSALSFILLVILMLPGSLSALTTSRTFPNIPWNGIGIDLETTGNIIFGQGKTYPNGGRQDVELCSADGGPVNSINLKGLASFELAGYNGKFVFMEVIAGIYNYGPGATEPTLVQQQRETIYAPTAPRSDFPFNIPANLPAGDRLGFSISATYCEEFGVWPDPSYSYECYPLIYTATSFEYRFGPSPCFSISNFSPENNAENVDFEKPEITVTFTKPVDYYSITVADPLDPDFIEKSTFQVYYWDENDHPIYVGGKITTSSDGKQIKFQPAEGKILDGVRYGIKIWGKTDAVHDNRTRWINGAEGEDLAEGKEWVFWTMPDLTDKIEVVPVQSVENTDLIKDKPTVVRIFMRWEAKPQVNPIKQLETLKADIQIDWFGSTSGNGQWSEKDSKDKWEPAFGSPRKREYKAYTTDMESYNKNEKIKGEESVNYYGFTPRTNGSVNFIVTVIPLGPKTSPPRPFRGQSATFNIRTAPRIRYAMVPLNVGDWAATGKITTCPTGIGGPCVNLQGMGDDNHYFMRDLFPFAPSNWSRTRTLNNIPLVTPYNPSQYSYTKGTDGNLVSLLRELNHLGSTSSSPANTLYVGVVPRSWMDCGNTLPTDIGGRDLLRRAILICHDAGDVILAHEMGHLMGDWFDEKPAQMADDGFQVARKWPWRNSTHAMPGIPNLNSITNLMDEVINNHALDPFWLKRDSYIELYAHNHVIPFTGLKTLNAGESLLLASGIINVSTNAVIRDPWYVLDSGAWDPPTPGEYELVLLDSGSNVLNNHPFKATDPVDGFSHFILKIPYPSSTARIQIRRNNTVIDDVTPSSQTPQLTITTPSGGVSWSGAQNITWTAGDGDGDPLHFALLLSADGGSSWETIGVNLQGNSYTFDTRGVYDSTNCFVKIAASDGLRTAIQTVGPFTIRNPLRALGFNPGSNQTGVAVRDPIRVEFSEAVNPGTLTANTVYLQNVQGQRIPGTIDYNPDLNEAVFTPDSPLDYNTTYTVHLTGGILPPEGTPPENLPMNWSFTTESNVYPPQVVHFSPRARENNASLNATLVTVRFDKPMNPATLTAQSFAVTAPNGGGVTGQITYVPETHTALFYPALNWSPNTRYTVTLSSAVLDADGNALQGPFSWSFQTGNENTGWVRFTRNFLDYTLDQDGDGVWDTLVVDVEVSVLFTSTYSLKGRLLDKNGRFIANATTGNVALSGGVHVLPLYFSRQDIQNHGVEGPYYFADGFLIDVSYPSSSSGLGTPYLTHFTNFTVDADLLLFAVPDPGVLGQNLTFYASIDNQGTSSASGVVLTATLPSSVDFVSATTSQGSCSHNAGTVTCSIGTVGSLQNNLVSSVVTPREKGWIQFNASVTSVQDSYVANNDRQLALEIGVGNNVLYLPLIMNQ